MNDRRKNFGAFIIPSFVFLLTLGNYSRLTGTENIRAIHIVSLIAMGMALGVLLRNVVGYFVKDRNV